MYRALLRPLFCLSLLIGAGSVGAAAVRAEEFTPIIGWDQQLFPSYIISSSTLRMPPPQSVEPPADTSPEGTSDVDVESEAETEADESGEETAKPAPSPVENILGDVRGLLGVALTSPEADCPVTVTVSCDEILEPSTFRGELESEGAAYVILPQIRYRFSRLGQIHQATPMSITFTVTLGDSAPVEQTSTVLVRPIHDCPFLLVSGDKVVNISRTYAAYVNEQHPFLDKLLREALTIGIVDSFKGYQGGDDASVIRQVYALWDAMAARDVRYSSITASSSTASTVASQHVRLIEESINNSQANCVDGSVLMASLLRKIGIESFLMLTPTHCYMGFYLDRTRERSLLLETTAIGTSEDLNGIPIPDDLSAAVDESLRDEYSWPRFVAATLLANKAFAEDQEKFRSPDQPEYEQIVIADARRMGVLPIPFSGQESFVENIFTSETSDSAQDADTSSSEQTESASDSETEEMTESEDGIETADDSTENGAESEDSKEGAAAAECESESCTDAEECTECTESEECTESAADCSEEDSSAE
jgi:hypothetical protein